VLLDSNLTPLPVTGQSARENPALSGRPSARDLLPTYDAYRRWQARELLTLAPPEGLRAIYRQARAARGAPIADPVALVADHVLARMPLPPFYVWCHDFRTHLDVHLDEPWMQDRLPTRDSPLALAVREEELRGDPWTVQLAAYHDGGGWRGRLLFAREASRSWRTGDVFRESSACALTESFRVCARETLEAFLRSVTP
jgi:hypothetical protein